MRVRFLIDGFNVYHGLRTAAWDRSMQLGGPGSHAGTKWFDLPRYCRDYVRTVLPHGAQLERILYFSALATHLQASEPDVVARHHTYLDCLRDQDVEVILGRFKETTGRTCPTCGGAIVRHEEKETDVAIAAQLMAAFAEDRCDTAVLVTGDTDMTPVVKAARATFPTKKIGFLFPHGRSHSELQKLADSSARTTQRMCLSLQMADPFVKRDGSVITKPPSW